MNDFKQKLGRLYIPDNRDKKYLINDILDKDDIRLKYKYWWSNGWWGNQGDKPYCVAYSWVHWLAAGPQTQLVKRSLREDGSPFDTTYLYKEAQKVDSWPGENYDGTSVRAGADILKKHGFISEYRWSWDIKTTIKTLLTVGPVVVGTWWTEKMFYPNIDGIIKPCNNKMGGHAYLLDGINTEKKLIRIKNSWGKKWGKNGFAYISFDDMEKLIKDDGEICLATEIEKME